MSVYSVEHILRMLVGLDNSKGHFTIPAGDRPVISSIAKQVTRGTGLTERQHDLVKSKLLGVHYVTQFYRQGVTPHEYEKALATTDLPLREIDRTMSIELINSIADEDISQFLAQRYEDRLNSPWVKVTFPFSKRIITLLDSVKEHTQEVIHSSGSNSQYFKFNERIVFMLLKIFEGEGIEVDNELTEYLKKLETITKNKTAYLPYAKEGVVENLHPEAQSILESKLGKPSVENFFQYKDRSVLFDIRYFDEELLEQSTERCSSLTKRLIKRESVQVLTSPADYTIEEIVESLIELKRFPVMCIVTNPDSVRAVYKILKHCTSNNEVSVLFRMDNVVDPDFNKFVKDNELNSPVTDHTKVVFVSKDKLPKPLVKSGWYPEAILRVGSTRVQTKIDQWTTDCDLVVHYDTVASPWVNPHSNNVRKSKKRIVEKLYGV